jgi:hypothetical protein
MSPRRQGEGPPEVPVRVDVYAWVDPIAGVDATAQINDPAQPFKRLQVAIDTCYTHMVQLGVTSVDPTQAVIYAQPGVYGPIGQAANGLLASGDSFPIRLRDRVHVRGVRARDCIVRGVNNPTGPSGTHFPNRPLVGGQFMHGGGTSQYEALVDLTFVDFGNFGPAGGVPPWYDGNHLERDCLEVFDGFTFQGGDVQVWASAGTLYNAGCRAVISNCVFDMRNGFEVEPSPGAPGVLVDGPTFGVALNKQVLQSNRGYTDQQILLLGDTFVFGRFDGTQFVEKCLQDAVGVIDFSDPGCLFATAGSFDCDQILRGVGNIGIVNCLFRTFPDTIAQFSPRPMAMLGIDVKDTEIVSGSGLAAIILPTNAFAPSRVGSNNGGPPAQGPVWPTRPIGMFSTMVTTGVVSIGTPPNVHGWDCGGATTNVTVCFPPPGCPPGHPCAVAPAPVPAIAIYDGPTTPGVDPGFVGEYLSSVGVGGVVDWRLLPDSPLKDAGFDPGLTHRIVMSNGATFDFTFNVPEADPFEFDGEGYGNPRVVDNSVDIGFDETHLLTMAGSYSNNSTSHHQPGSLNPELTAAGFRRYVFLPQQAGGVTIGVGQHVIINGKMQDSASAGSAPIAWYRPPATLYRPVVDAANLPVHYQTRYISFNNSAPPGITLPTPWSRTLALPDLVSGFSPPTVPQGQQPFMYFVAFFFDDDECSPGPCRHWYFNSEAVVRADGTSSVDLLWSNLQAEYR